MRKRVFVIMPSEDFCASKEKKEIILSCARERDWAVQLPDYDRNIPSFDLDSTMAILAQCDLVLVDLSNERPSCYFELGLAEASGLNIMAVAAEGTSIHQTSLRDTVSFFADLEQFQQIIRVRLEQKTEQD